MNKITYLNELETALDALPRHLRDQKMYEFLISLLLLFCPIILLASAISRGIVDSISNVFFAISYSGLGLVFIIVIFKILEYIYRLILKYLLWYIKTVKGSVRKWRNSFLLGF